MFFIGIDLGTSAVKMLLTDENGTIAKIVSREYPVVYPKPGWSEQSPEDWWTAVKDGMPELIADIDATAVRGIGLGGQMHGLVVLDADDRVIRPAILWNDSRTQEQTDWLNNEIGRDKLAAWTGNIAFAGFTAPKLLWMREHEPELFAKISKIMLPKDYITYCLTGAFVTDYSDASGFLLLDVKNRRWSGDMLTLCGITEAQLPALHESADAVGTLLPEAAAALGLPENVTVCAGAGDNAAAAVGCGAVGEGHCNLSLGTSGTVFITSRSFSMDSRNALHAFAHADGGWHLMGVVLSAASCNRWWLEHILSTADYNGEQAAIKPGVPDTDDPYFVPYLMGERSPHNDAMARGAFTGLRMDTSRADLTRAVLEGVAFAVRDSIEIARAQGIQVNAGTICGGGAKSPLWRQMMADVLHMRLDLPQTEQGPGYGGAMLAMVACGVYPDVETCAARLVRVKESTFPDPEAEKKCDARYRIWREWYPALKPVCDDMQR